MHSRGRAGGGRCGSGAVVGLLLLRRSALHPPTHRLTPLDSRVDTTSARPCTAAAISAVAPLAAGAERGWGWGPGAAAGLPSVCPPLVAASSETGAFFGSSCKQGRARAGATWQRCSLECTTSTPGAPAAMSSAPAAPVTSSSTSKASSAQPGKGGRLMVMRCGICGQAA